MANYSFCNENINSDLNCPNPVETEGERCWMHNSDNKPKPLLVILKKAIDKLVKLDAANNQDSINFSIFKELAGTLGSMNLVNENKKADEQTLSEMNIFFNDVFEEDNILKKIESSEPDSVYELASLISYISVMKTTSSDSGAEAETSADDPFGNAFG